MMLMPAIVLGYAWILYPLLLLLLRTSSSSRSRPAEPTDQSAGSWPRLAVLVAAHNEGANVAARIRNIRESDYPTSRVTVWIGADGCTDDTVERARHEAVRCGDAPRVRVVAYERNRGKAAVLRDLVALACEPDAGDSPLLVFTDANTDFHPDALRRLARGFEDARTGGVCGRLVFRGKAVEERAYWNLESAIKVRESEMDSCLGANGAIYAIRPECFWRDLPENTIVDDFVIGMKVRESGYRMRFDPDAVAEEDLPDIRDEWRRRVRIGSGDYQALGLCRACLHPRFGAWSWCFWSHKVLRWFTPHLALIMLVAACVAGVWSRVSVLPAAVAGLALGIGLAAMGVLAAAWPGRYWRRRDGGRGWQRICRGADHFVTMQAALFVGFIRFCRGNLSGAWARTPRVVSKVL